LLLLTSDVLHHALCSACDIQYVVHCAPAVPGGGAHRAHWVRVRVDDQSIIDICKHSTACILVIMMCWQHVQLGQPSLVLQHALSCCPHTWTLCHESAAAAAAAAANDDTAIDNDASSGGWDNKTWYTKDLSGAGDEKGYVDWPLAAV
jgi:hypothetical protein